jgi:NAD-dependent DNA ligase
LLTYVAGRTVLDVDGLGPLLAAALVEHKLVSDLADLFEFQIELKAAISAS